jgi:F-type H+-transporting ATPase subunit alpha
MERGRDVLIVYDDLTRHARAYREISLLLERSPGREAYPGDIFYIHSRLLERSTRLGKKYGGGSLTALPIIETEAENLSAYIPTNVISITDGQLYLSPVNFQKGLLPAIHIGKSVSRVGSEAQVKAYKTVAGPLGIAYSQFEELEMFSRFATKLDDDTKKIINRGQKVREILKQPRYDTINTEEQIAIFLCVTNGVFDSLKEEEMPDAEKKVRKLIIEDFKDLAKMIRAGEKMSDSDKESFLAAARKKIGVE